MYREQVIQLEDELSRIREEGDVTREVFQVWMYCYEHCNYYTCQYHPPNPHPTLATPLPNRKCKFFVSMLTNEHLYQSLMRANGILPLGGVNALYFLYWAWRVVQGQIISV
jgi:hypothetical protein